MVLARSSGRWRPISASILSAIIEDIDYFPSANHLSSFFGTVPTIRHSSDYKPSGGMSKRGNLIARKTLVQSTTVAKRYHPFLQAHNLRLRKKKPTRKALIAKSRKLLIIIYHAMVKDIVYTDFYNNIHILKEEWVRNGDQPLWPRNTPNYLKNILKCKSHNLSLSGHNIHLDGQHGSRL